MLAAGSSLNVAPSVKLLPSMEIIRTISWMKEVSRQARAENQIIGLVPTMGALHEGHFSLIRRARQECSKVFTSIFVNSKQFGPNEDFAKYPRAFESDVEQLAAAGVDAVFAPEAAEMYPGGFHSYVNVEGLSERLEGRTRPGHFRGVATVVLKLFQIFQPHVAYFGRKDAQQVRIVQQMARDLNLDVEIAVCPIVRERDGLALSSRNSYFSAPRPRFSIARWMRRAKPLPSARATRWNCRGSFGRLSSARHWPLWTTRKSWTRKRLSPSCASRAPRTCFWPCSSAKRASSTTSSSRPRPPIPTNWCCLFSVTPPPPLYSTDRLSPDTFLR